MPLSDIAIAQSSFPNYLIYPRVQPFVNGEVQRFSWHWEERWASLWKSFQYPGNSNFYVGHCTKPHPKFLIEANSTLEQKYPLESEGGHKENGVLSSTVARLSSTINTDSSNEDLEDVNGREKLRCIQISKTNKGNTPWNEGRRHSPETLQLIRERTRIAMQNPKVKMKLVAARHAKSEGTREKIAAGVRMGWQRRRERLKLQETCLFDWNNLIADAARKGFLEEEELQWNSYEILKERLQQECLDSIEYRKKIPRHKGSRRGPKSPEHRRRIAEAIVAKWADPEFRSKFHAGMAKYYGTPEEADWSQEKPSREGQTSSTINEFKMRAQQSELKKRTTPKFKDPLASAKLEILKSIRAQRAASESKNEALQRAELLIQEAEKAAKTLELAAMRSPVAQASLIETRKLIAEAMQSIETVKNRQLKSHADISSENRNFVEENAEALTEDLDQDQERVNGVASPQLAEGHHQRFNPYKLTMLEEIDVDDQLPTILTGRQLHKLGVKGVTQKVELGKVKYHHGSQQNGAVRSTGISSPDGAKLQNHQEQIPVTAKAVTKKWVRGRLVEVPEGE